jgi:hypothetical protein
MGSWSTLKRCSTGRTEDTHVRAYVRHWAELTSAERVEVVSASRDARLIRESLEAGEILPAGEGLYYSRATSGTPPAKWNAPSSPPEPGPTGASTTTRGRPRG